MAYCSMDTFAPSIGVAGRFPTTFVVIRNRPPLLDMTEQLIKLKADLDCLERMTELWSDRISAFPVWYPYSRRVSDLLSATSLLTLSLNRHIEPLLLYLEQGIANHEWPGPGEYEAYFIGGIERIWNGPTNNTEEIGMRTLQDSGRLHRRLLAVLEPLLELLSDEAKIKPCEIKKALPGWLAHFDHSKVWLTVNN
jgi:hypothetical protein